MIIQNLRSRPLRCIVVLCLGLFALSWEVVASDAHHTTKECSPDLSPGLHPERVRLSHIEGRGIGYNRGYSSLDLFFTVPTHQNHVVPFLDLRGHIFNNGKLAANAGLGVRWLTPSIATVWGVNAYYDYRVVSYKYHLSSNQHYNQVSWGIEALRKQWDFRANSYLPVGQKRPQFYDYRFDYQGGSQYLLRGKFQFALRGVDAEAGYHYSKIKHVQLYAAAGPYYYSGTTSRNAIFARTHESALGGRLLARATLFSYVTAEASASYDHLFKWIGQGRVSLNFNFGPRQHMKKPKFMGCSERAALLERLYQDVEHHEMIVVRKIHKRSNSSGLIDPDLDL
jgi:hypothetical protein